MKKIVLAYSGGLDTSIILKWLIDKGDDRDPPSRLFSLSVFPRDPFHQKRLI